MALNANVNLDAIELLPIKKQSSQNNLLSNNAGVLLTSTPKMKRANASTKKLQFSTPEFSVTPIAALPGSSNRVMIPNRKR